MADNIIQFVRAYDPDRRMIRVDVLLDAVQHFAFIEVDAGLVSRLMQAATLGLEEQALWVEINAGDCRRLQSVNFERLDAMLIADFEEHNQHQP